MLSLALASISFAGLHLLVSGTRLRDALVNRMGELKYRGVFSLASAVALAWLIWSYNRIGVTEVTPLWAWRSVAAVLMAPAVGFVVLGLLTVGPTGVGTENKVHDEQPAKGIHRVTRHPFLWGVAIWAIVHMAYNAAPAQLLFFGCFLVVAVSGTFSIDAKRARQFGEAWTRYSAQTSNIPFAAILQRRTRMVFSELGWIKPLAAIAVYLVIVMFHARLFGVPPF